MTYDARVREHTVACFMAARQYAFIARDFGVPVSAFHAFHCSCPATSTIPGFSSLQSPSVACMYNEYKCNFSSGFSSYLQHMESISDRFQVGLCRTWVVALSSSSQLLGISPVKSQVHRLVTLVFRLNTNGTCNAALPKWNRTIALQHEMSVNAMET